MGNLAHIAEGVVDGHLVCALGDVGTVGEPSAHDPLAGLRYGLVWAGDLAGGLELLNEVCHDRYLLPSFPVLGSMG